MVSFEVGTITELLQYCAGVLMLAFSAYLIGRTGTLMRRTTKQRITPEPCCNGFGHGSHS